MSPTGSANLGNLKDNGCLQRLSLHEKAGFLVVAGQVVAYRYSEESKQLSITNLDGGAIFKPLSNEHALQALETIHGLAPEFHKL